MAGKLSTTMVAATRMAGRVALLVTGATASVIPFAADAHAGGGTPAPNINRGVGMYGDPAAAAPYWRRQHSADCGEMAVADVVGQITGNEPSEQQITTLAESMRSTVGPGPIYVPTRGTEPGDLPALLAHYGIRSALVQTSTSGLEQDLAAGHKVIVSLNSETIWNAPGRRNSPDHLLVVIGIDPRAGVVHLNDSGINSGRDEQVPLATFERAWATGRNEAVVTK